MRDPCPLCAGSGVVRVAVGVVDACGRCAGLAEAEYRFAQITARPPAAPVTPRRPRTPRAATTRHHTRRAGGHPQPQQVTA